jgi:hypothetical protein
MGLAVILHALPLLVLGGSQEPGEELGGTGTQAVGLILAFHREVLSVKELWPTSR